MESSANVDAPPVDPERSSPAPSSPTVHGAQRLVLIVLIALAALSLLPALSEFPGITRTLWVSAAGFGAWLLALRWLRRGSPNALVARVEIVRAHYVQAAVQFCIYLYWGWFTPEVAGVAPRIVAQLLFLYALQALLAWTRGRAWTIGFGPLPIIFSTNLLLWFKPEWLALQYGLARAGVTLVTANTALKGAEISYILGKSGAKALFFARATPSNDLEGVVRGLDRAALPELRHTLGLDGASCDGSRSFEDFVAGGASQRDRVAEIERGLSVDDVINMQYTSGTTGFPKGVMLTHRNLVQNAAVISPILGYSPSDRLCVSVPLFHCFGCVIATLASHNSGVALVLVETFNADVALDTCERERCTALYGVPTMFVAELEAQRRKPRTCAAMPGGA